MDHKQGHEPIRAARRILSDFVALRQALEANAEGFAVLDFAQGNVATDLPADTARDIVALFRNDPAHVERAHNELVLVWLESYRRAYSRMIMRVLEDGGDARTA